MIVVNTETINGKEFEVIGLVIASAVQTKNALKDIGAGLKNMFGGELTSY